jgi:hypothetical protein
VWLAPLAESSYEEPYDHSLLELTKLTQLAPQMAKFWPSGGPHWDAVAVAGTAEPIIVLVEAKANVEEFKRGDRRATAQSSIMMIDESLAWARERLSATGSAESWVGRHYQFANRLACTLWLRELGVTAVLAHVLFTDDGSHQPMDAAELQAGSDAALVELGVSASVLDGWAATVVVPSSK